MLHLTNGDAAADLLRQSGVPGEVVVWADVLHEGRVPAAHGPDARRARAESLSSMGYGPFEELYELGERWHAALQRYREHDELVLWFEHDLFDQLLLARHLHWLGTQAHARTRLSLICIDRFPGVSPFHGLGQLTPDQLASLWPQRQPISDEQLRTGADVWRAFTDPDPRALNTAAACGLACLPFMSAALVRYLEDFPGLQDGLSRTERSILEALVGGSRRPDALFAAVSEREERVFTGDATFWIIVRGLARGSEPLVTIRIDGIREDRLPQGEVALAPAGRRVLDGQVDAVALRGIDRWRGGVHLTPTTDWRWDPESRRVRLRAP